MWQGLPRVAAASLTPLSPSRMDVHSGNGCRLKCWFLVPGGEISLLRVPTTLVSWVPGAL